MAMQEYTKNPVTGKLEPTNVVGGADGNSSFIGRVTAIDGNYVTVAVLGKGGPTDTLHNEVFIISDEKAIGDNVLVLEQSGRLLGTILDPSVSCDFDPAMLTDLMPAAPDDGKMYAGSGRGWNELVGAAQTFVVINKEEIPFDETGGVITIDPAEFAEKSTFTVELNGASVTFIKGIDMNVLAAVGTDMKLYTFTFDQTTGTITVTSEDLAADVDLSELVRSVDGVMPDANGNIVLTIQLTQAEFDAIPPAEIKPGVRYIITDAPGCTGGGGISDPSQLISSQASNRLVLGTDDKLFVSTDGLATQEDLNNARLTIFKPLQAVNTFADLLDPSTLDRTINYLCRVTSEQKVYSLLASGGGWELYSDITDFVVEEDMLVAIQDGLATTMRKGVPGLYNQLPEGITPHNEFQFNTDLDVFWRDHIEGRWFDGGVTINIERASTRSMSIGHVVTFSVITISSAVRVASQLNLTHIIGGIIGLTSRGVNFGNIECSRCTYLTLTGHVASVGFGTVRSSAIRNLMSGTCSVSQLTIDEISSMRIRGSASVTDRITCLGAIYIDDDATGTLPSTLHVGSQGFVIDNRPGRPLETFSRRGEELVKSIDGVQPNADGNIVLTVKLTQAEFDAIPPAEIKPGVRYIITDAPPTVANWTIQDVIDAGDFATRNQVIRHDVAQTLTTTQQQQARDNMGVVSGSPSLPFYTTTGTAPNYVLTVPNLGTIVNGTSFVVMFHANHVAAAARTLNVNGGGAVALQQRDHAGGAVAAGPIFANTPYFVVRQATSWVLTNMQHLRHQDIAGIATTTGTSTTVPMSQAATTAAIGASNTYRSAERDTGSTWVSGLPVFTRTVVSTATPTTTMSAIGGITLAAYSPQMNLIIKGEGVSIGGLQQSPIATNITSTGVLQVQSMVANMGDTFITLWYTKQTPVTHSGWNTPTYIVGPDVHHLPLHAQPPNAQNSGITWSLANVNPTGCFTLTNGNQLRAVNAGTANLICTVTHGIGIGTNFVSTLFISAVRFDIGEVDMRLFDINEQSDGYYLQFMDGIDISSMSFEAEVYVGGHPSVTVPLGGGSVEYDFSPGGMFYLHLDMISANALHLRIDDPHADSPWGNFGWIIALRRTG
jgi:hypothetical protein